MKLVRATAGDSDRLNEFFKNTVWPAPVSLRFHRMGNFLTPYEMQSDDFVTVMLEDKNERAVRGLATLIFREGVIEGKKQIIGYATDLRVANSRRAVLQWSQHFLPVFEEELRKRNCNYVFSVVTKYQRQAYNAFIRPRSPKRKLPRYYQFRRFDVVGLHGLWPFAAKPLTGISISNGSANHIEELSEYIFHRKSLRPLYFGASPKEFTQSLSRWKTLGIEDFIIARDSFGRIIGCTAPWSSSKIEKLAIDSFDTKGRSFYETLQVLSLLRLAHKLPMPGAHLNFCYLTHLYADNPDIFYSLLFHAWQQLNKNEFLAYPHFETHLQNTPPRSFISSKVSCGLYCVMPPNEAPPAFLKPTPLGEPPDFELPFL